MDTRVALLLCLLLLLAGCDPQKRLNRLLLKYPQLRDTVVVHDTVEALVEYVRADTVLRWLPGDTITLTKDRLRVRTVIQHDTVWQLGECLPDTVRVPYSVEVPVVQPAVVRDRVPWWVYLLCGASLLIALLALFKR